ncbi:hypothetical protein ACSS6W_001591 [Trichoderma asperelloides]
MPMKRACGVVARGGWITSCTDVAYLDPSRCLFAGDARSRRGNEVKPHAASWPDEFVGLHCINCYMELRPRDTYVA